MNRWLRLISIGFAALICGIFATLNAQAHLTDGANRLTNTITPLTRSTKQVYDNRGLLQSVTLPSTDSTTFWHDAKARLTNRVDNAGSTIYQYDPNNNLTNAFENGKTNSWTFDTYDRVSSYRDADGNLIQYRYDANANLTSLIYPGNRTVTYAYDSLNRLTNVTDWAQRKTTITYDLASRMTNITRPNGTYRTLNYDAAGQVTNVLEQMANTLPIALFRFNWINTGNMAWEFAAPLPHPATVPTRTMTYDDDNRLATVNGQNVTMDLNGNLYSGPLTNETLAAYAYDARNRLLNVGGVTNVYDAANNRIAQTKGTNGAMFVVNPNARLPQVLMRIQSGVTNYYVYGNGLLYQVTETDTATSTLTYHFDYRGSTVALTDDNGKPTDRIEYSAYGLTTYRLGTNDTPFLFNGRYGVMTDPNGLLYMRARYYNPYLCRFINPDPSGFSGGLNHYAYANGNPVSYLDPFGLDAIASGSSLSSSWVDDIATALGFDTSIAAQIDRQQTMASFINFVTLGLADDISIATTGYDLHGNRATQQEQITAGVMAAINLIPVGNLEAMGTRVAEGAADLGMRLAADTAASITTPYAVEVQGATRGALSGLSQAQSGANLFRTGELGTSMAGESQYWSLQNPLTPGYANSMGMPNVSPNFMMGGALNPGASVIANQAGGLGANAGQGIQIVTSPGGVGINWFHMP